MNEPRGPGSQPRSGRALANQREYSNIVELAVDVDGLDVELSRRIMFTTRGTFNRDTDEVKFLKEE